ncbi:MerR family transcriptional regulator [Sanguibacter antarcticus]|uniref:DNA-binding transcriptional MerR regulator n=1 Tax=Sanguibacter antarcticus TaxID=372484 RepID=A0A2A9E8T9_9MICO|nr:MerR family transcriptional regulator [Sanguibacter antarcticus]PFG34642.1 DNA-binding transcriptional MerR regulator [Sanguibacter antarcticus]
MAIDERAPERTYSIGELADLAGLSVHALRWYESQGLFPRDVPRTTAGRRVFDAESVRWLALLTRLRDSGMPVAEMARYSALVRAGDGNEAERIALMQEHARSLDEQIAELEACRDVITDKIHMYQGALASGARRPVSRA